MFWRISSDICISLLIALSVWFLQPRVNNNNEVVSDDDYDKVDDDEHAKLIELISSVLCNKFKQIVVISKHLQSEQEHIYD